MKLRGYGIAGEAHDFFARRADGQVWNNQDESYEPWNDANFADYRIPATAQGNSRFYIADAPDEAIITFELRKRGDTLADSFLRWAGDLFADQLELNAEQILAAVTLDAGVPVADGDVIELYRGGSRTKALGNPIAVKISAEKWDLTGLEGRFALQKLVDGEAGDKETLAKPAEIVDAGGPDQRIVVELTKAETEDLALDELPIRNFDVQTGRAYAYQIGPAKPGESQCHAIAVGEASVRPLHLDCTGNSS